VDPTTRASQTLFDKIWRTHHVLKREDGQSLLYVDSHFLQDGSAPAFEMLRQRGLKAHAPQRGFATPDHYVPTDSRDLASIADPEKRAMADALRNDSKSLGITFFGLDDKRQGIVHVVAPEQGLSRPGMLIVCGDSHTSTHGAVGALAFGIGATEVAHVLATQTLWQRKPKALRIVLEGTLPAGIGAKDVILAIIAKIGAGGATGRVIEYAGPVIAGMSMEGRFTICNMSIEAGGRAGMIAPDDTTFNYLAAGHLRRPASSGSVKWRAGAHLHRTPTRPSTKRSRSTSAASDRWSPGAIALKMRCPSTAVCRTRRRRRTPSAARRCSAPLITWV
jgi:3-isopropylmalate/(R)-2-methylmalate dehydratase large subunit